MILCICPNPSIDKFIFLDAFDVGGVNRTKKELSYPGGKGVHVALGVKELGEEVILLSFWGGITGKWIKKECQKKGVICLGPEVEHWNRTCLTIKSKGEFNESEILGTGPNIGLKEYEAFFSEYKKLLKKVKFVCFSGSWPMNSFNANYSEFVEYASRLKIKSFVDCSGKGLKKVLTKRPFMVHVNHKEAHELYSTDEIEENILNLIKSCSFAVISYGDKGLFLYDGKNFIHALSRVENVLSAVGSGDSLMAAMVVAFKRNYTLLDIAKLAAAAGASNCIREDLGMFYKKDTERLFKNCKASIRQLT